jgi:3-dehydroquinate synthase
MLKRPQNSKKYFSKEAFRQLDKHLQNQAFSQIFVVVDANTQAKCLPVLLQNVYYLKNYQLVTVPVGEEAKSPAVLTSLWQTLSHHHADRHSLVLNLGGGVVTDLGGFLAATYMRGIAFINFPTSLLAMADAASGGKTGINLSGYKNRIGAFAEPLFVGVVPQFLATLPHHEKLSGWAEMLKHGLIGDASHFYDLSNASLDVALNQDLLAKTIAIKEEICHQDPTEQGLRKILNFGHTVGHALESASHGSGQPLAHGYAVGLGMQVELQLSVGHAGLSRQAAQKAQDVLARWYPWPAQKWPKASLEKYLRGDKKNYGAQLHFSLLEKIGKAVYNVELSVPETLAALEKFTTLA